MTATATRYRSGHCGNGFHGRCTGSYGHAARMAACNCECHELVQAAIDHDIEVALREHVLQQCVIAAINETTSEGLDDEIRAIFTPSECQAIADVFQFASICGESGAEKKVLVLEAIRGVDVAWTQEKADLFLATFRDTLGKVKNRDR